MLYNSSTAAIMRKFIVLCFALANVSHIYGAQSSERVKNSGRKVEERIKELSQLNPNSLFLSPPEIKLFSGYTLDLIRSKCLHINSTKIFQLQKFVSKRSTGKIHEVSEKRTAFHQLLKSIRTCNARLSQRSISTYRDWTLVLENLLKDILAQAKVAIHRSGMTEKIQWLYNAIMGQVKSLKGILNGTESMIPGDLIEKFGASFGDRARRRRSVTSAVEGESVFRQFLGLALKIYVNTCQPAHKLVLFFKAASEDLFNYLTVDKYITKKASAYYLPSDFLKNLSSCAGNPR